jgi:putative addiction module component (TIGR02574 family)
MALAPSLDALLTLPAERRLALIEALWDSLAADQINVPVPDWHLELLAERLAEDDATPAAADSWAEVRRLIEQQ